MIAAKIMPKIYKESFSSYNINSNPGLGSDMGPYPSSLTNYYLQDSYPLRTPPGLSNNSASDMWWHYPTFKEGSYKQITNNLKYFKNPDIGRCTAPDMCGTIYRNKKNKSNYIKSLPPINPSCGTRVGYFTTGINLLPYRTNIPNVLY
jgi:hypothetical protein